MDNYYLNNAVYLAEDFLKTTKDPAYGGEVAYGDRAEHCWNGDPHARQRVFTPALSPDVHSEVRDTRAGDRPGRRRRAFVAILTGVS